MLSSDRPSWWMSVLVVMLLSLAISIALVVSGAKRYLKTRRETQDLADEHELALRHVRLRMAAQKAQVAADEAVSPADRIRCLRRAVDLWREAYATRRQGDPDTAAFISDQVKLVESELDDALAQDAALPTPEEPLG
ncbi:MAG: hypothetical protein HZB16_09155 [Armatimonadetes bacterium]|nr:hypothetical protein [Armatimonadota bacterium]